MTDEPAAEPKRTAPLGILVSALSDIRKAILPAVAGAYGIRSEFAGVGFIAAIGILAVAFGVIGGAVRWWRTTYTVGAEDIRVETGLLARAARSVPYDRIQDVSMEQPLLARALGLAQVRFETGAGGKDEIALAWLPLAESAALRELVRERKDDETTVSASGAPAATALSSTGPGSTAPASTYVATTSEPEGEILFAMPPRRLATFGLFEFSLAAFAVALGAAQQFDNFLPFDVWDWEGWQARLDGGTHWLAALGPFAQAAAISLALLVLVVVVFLTGLLRTVARDWDFALRRTAKGFRRTRGLFTKSDVVMPAHRVQAIEVRTRLLRRLFGWYDMKFVSLAQDSGGASHVVAPFAKLDEIEPIARAAGFALPTADVDWHRAAPRAFVDRWALGSILPVAAAAALLFSKVPALAVLPLLALPVIAARQYFRWRRARHALDGRQVYTRHGWLVPSIDVASRVRLQSVEIAQGPLARRGGYATLHLGLAGGTLAFDAVPLAEARRIRAAVLDSIAGVDFAEAMAAR